MSKSIVIQQLEAKIYRYMHECPNVIEAEYPSAKLLQAVSDFVMSYPEVYHQWEEADISPDGTVLLDFVNNVEIVVGEFPDHIAFYPVVKDQYVERFYIESEVNEMVKKFFPNKINLPVPLPFGFETITRDGNKAVFKGEYIAHTNRIIEWQITQECTHLFRSTIKCGFNEDNDNDIP